LTEQEKKAFLNRNNRKNKKQIPIVIDDVSEMSDEPIDLDEEKYKELEK
jgi:hypothetical protein